MSQLTRRDALRVVGVAGVTSVAGCSSFGLWDGPDEHPPRSIGTSWSPSAGAWRFPYADLQNTAQTPHELHQQPTIEWQDRVDDGSNAPISGELVAATPHQVFTAGEFDREIHLRAYAATDGTRLWHRRIQYPSGRRAPQFGGLVDDTLYVTDGGTDIIAINAVDGTVRWRRNLYQRVAENVPRKFLTPYDSPADFSPRLLGTPETVYVQTNYGVHGLAPGDGTEQWRLYLGAQTDSAALEDPYGLAVTDRRVWVSYGGHVQSLFTIKQSDGSPEIKRTRLPLDFPATPVVTSDQIVTLTHAITWATSPLEMLAAGVRGDEVEWQFPGYAGEGAAAYSPLVTDGKRVFVCASHEQPEQLIVVALRASTGKLEWLHRESLADRDVSVTDGRAFRLCQPAVTGDSLIIGYGGFTEAGTGHGELIAVSRTEGRVRWRTDFSVAPRRVAVTSNRLYVGSQQGGVVALTGAGSE